MYSMDVFVEDAIISKNKFQYTLYNLYNKILEY